MHPNLSKFASELMGTALLLCVVSGSGIMADRLAGGNVAIALLANTAATVCGLFFLIELFGPVGGAHFNPLVSVVLALEGRFLRSLLVPYICAQLCGAVLGVWLAHAMFDLPILQFSTKVRSGIGQWISECVATAGLLLVVLRAPANKAAGLVAAYIAAAYWFTASTSFANPAAAFGRMWTESFAGIAPACVMPYVISQIAGAGIGMGAVRLIQTRGGAGR